VLFEREYIKCSEKGSYSVDFGKVEVPNLGTGLANGPKKVFFIVPVSQDAQVSSIFKKYVEAL